MGLMSEIDIEIKNSQALSYLAAELALLREWKAEHEKLHERIYNAINYNASQRIDDYSW